MSSRWRMGLSGLTLLCLAASAAQAGTWTNLWSTREQQAQKLLDSKNPAAAAPLFTDARRRAYAEMEAGQYAQAAKSLEPFKDVDSQYNRGNALAHSGQLGEALSAYDAALKAAPGNEDVIRNRDLVRRQLERQQQNQSGRQDGAHGSPGSQGSKGGNSRGGDQSQGGGQPQSGNPSQAGNQAGGQTQPGAQPQAANQQQNGGDSPSASQPPGSQTQPSGQSQSNPSQAANQPGNQASDPSHPGSKSQTANQSPYQSQAGNQQNANQPQSGGQEAQSQAANQPRPGAQPPAQAAGHPLSGSPGNDPSAEGSAPAPNGGQQTSGPTSAAGLNAENAQQDADAALRYRQSQQGRAAPGASPNDTGRRATLLAPDGKTRASADMPPPKPPSEQTLALDQWLRGIPDDSGELLRRKFLIEHRLKQQANQQ